MRLVDLLVDSKIRHGWLSKAKTSGLSHLKYGMEAIPFGSATAEATRKGSQVFV